MHEEQEFASWWTTFFSGPYQHLQRDEAENSERTSSEVGRMVERLSLGPGARVLDAPCGFGRHALELARRGFTVTGVDLNDEAVATARSRADAAGLSIDLRTGDMRDIEERESYDAALCMHGSFGYFGDSENLRHATAMANALKPGGRFLVETHIVETLARIFTPRDWYALDEHDTSVRLLQAREWDLETGRLNATWTFMRQDVEETYRSSIRIYSYHELCELLRAAGFTAFDGWDSAAPARFHIGSQRLMLVATR